MRRAAAGALLLLAAGRAAGAQAVRLTHAADPTAVAACLDAIPQSAFARVAVHVEARVDDADALAPLLPGADLLAQGVAQRLRAIADPTGGASGNGTIPAADALVPWRAVPAQVHLTAHRDGRLTWVRGDTGVLGTADTTGFVLLAQALADAHAAGEHVAWPDGLAGDSATFALRLGGPTVRRDGSAVLERVRRTFPAFTLPLPWSEPVRMLVEPEIVYPIASLRNEVEGTVVLRYVVDELGVARPETVAEEQWPASRPRPTGDLLRYYQAFVRATRRGLPTGRFEPAWIGGCAIPQLVQQGFAYAIRP